MKTKLLIRTVSLVLLVAILGCVSPELKRQALLNEVRSGRFIDLIKRGKTTREDEQAFIRESHKAWAAFREALGLEDVK